MNCKIFFAAVTTITAAQPVDVCTAMNATSVCLESGLCSNMTAPTPCYAAYVNISMHAFRYSNESAIIENLRFSNDRCKRVATWLSRVYVLPVSIDHTIPDLHTGMNQVYRDFETSLQNFKNVILRNFPYIRFVQEDNIVIHSLVAAADGLWRDPGYLTLRDSLLTGEFISDIREAFRLIIEVIASFSRSDPRRYSVFYNTIPFIHTWTVVHDLLALPPPFYAPEYLEFLTAAAQFDPYHTLGDRKWMLVIPQLDEDEIATTLPIIDLERMFPLQVIDYFDFSHEAGLRGGMQGVSHILARLGGLPPQGRWMAILLFSYHPAFSTLDRKKFCDSFSVANNDTFTFSGDKLPLIEMKVITAMLDLYRLCNDSVLTLSVRIKQILPLVLNRKSSNVAMVGYVVANASNPTVQDLIQIPLSVLRSTLRIRDRLFVIGRQGHVLYLTKFLRQYDPKDLGYLISSNAILNTADQQLLEAVGIAVALLFVERDPTGVLRELYPTLGFPSESFRRGFCKVVNCIAFHRLFKSHERNEILEYFRQQRLTIQP